MEFEFLQALSLPVSSLFPFCVLSPHFHIQSEENERLIQCRVGGGKVDFHFRSKLGTNYFVCEDNTQMKNRNLRICLTLILHRSQHTLLVGTVQLCKYSKFPDN
jgi:hypothetical protein